MPPLQISIRPFQPADLETLKQLTVESFSGVTLEQDIEQALGPLHGHDWKWRKARHVEEDVVAQADGIFVAELDQRVVGYISTRLDREAGKGRIPNLAVAGELRGQGLGRVLIDYALEFFRREGMTYAVIETMAENKVGKHLYLSCGFAEVARQIHFARRL